MEKRRDTQWIVGIDEAGRGPLAGPVAVGLVAMPVKLYRGIAFAKLGIRDSKKLTERKREAWYEWLQCHAGQRQLHFAVSLVDARTIDAFGIAAAIRTGIADCCKGLEDHSEVPRPSECSVLLDGGLRAPAIYERQQTIIRGDESEPIVSLASIMAKVTRDRHMVALAKKYPGYHFEEHKGYGTQDHYGCLERLGLSPLHRKTFCRRICSFPQSRV